LAIGPMLARTRIKDCIVFAIQLWHMARKMMEIS
jgi:hypothetical protein